MQKPDILPSRIHIFYERLATMGFWIFMLICDLLLPLTMIAVGKYFTKSAPKEINAVCGYRTAMSMKNQETWNYAHHSCGQIWRRLGWVLFAATIAGMLFAVGKPKDLVGAVSGIICGVQVVFLIGSIFPTEIALKKTFDENGFRRK